MIEVPMFVVAGPTGHVGSIVAERLTEAGKPLRVMVRNAAKGERWSSRGAEVAVGNLGDPAFVARALRGAEGFFTLMPPDYAVPDFFAAQRRYADAIASGVAASRVPRLVMLSSLGADLPDGTGPIKGLHYFENRLRETGTRLTAIRAAYFQENAESALAPARAAGIFPNFFDRDDMAIPMIATKDVGELAASALLEPPRASEIVDLIGPDYTARDVASALGRAIGRSRSRSVCPRCSRPAFRRPPRRRSRRCTARSAKASSSPSAIARYAERRASRRRCGKSRPES